MDGEDPSSGEEYSLSGKDECKDTVYGVVTAVQSSVNDTTTLSAPDIPVKEIGKVLPRLLHYMRDTPAGLHILFSKLDISDSGVSLSRKPTATTLLVFSPKRGGGHVGCGSSGSSNGVG